MTKQQQQNRREHISNKAKKSTTLAPKTRG